MNEKDQAVIRDCCKTLGIEEEDTIQKIIRSPFQNISLVDATADSRCLALEAQSEGNQNLPDNTNIWKSLEQFRTFVSGLQMCPNEVTSAAIAVQKAENVIKIIAEQSNIQGSARQIHRLSLPEIELTIAAAKEAIAQGEEKKRLEIIAKRHEEMLYQLFSTLREYFQQKEVLDKAKEVIRTGIALPTPTKQEPIAPPENETPPKRASLLKDSVQ